MEITYNGAVAKYPKSVIPAKAGIQKVNEINGSWIPAFAGMTEKVISQQRHNSSSTILWNVNKS